MAINFDDQSTGISYQQYPKDPQAREQIQILDNKVDELEQKTVSKQAIIDIESKVRQSDLDKENFKIAVTKELTDVKTVVEGIDGGNVEKIAEIEAAVNLKANKDVVDSLLNQIEGSVKQINGNAPDENGNVIIDVNTEGLATIEEVTTKTDELAGLVFSKAEKADVDILKTQVADKASTQSVTALTSQLADKATKAEVVTKMDKNTAEISITQIDKNKGLIDETYLSPTLKSQITGTTPISPAIAPKSLTEDVLAFPIVPGVFSKNLFNKNKAISGKLVQAATGALTTNTSYAASDFIPVTAGATYSKTSNHTYAWFDANFAYISGGSSGRIITAPANAAFINYTVTGTAVASEQFELGNAATGFESYGSKMNMDAIKGKVVPDHFTDWRNLTHGDIAVLMLGSGGTVPDINTKNKTVTLSSALYIVYKHQRYKPLTNDLILPLNVENGTTYSTGLTMLYIVFNTVTSAIRLVRGSNESAILLDDVIVMTINFVTNAQTELRNAYSTCGYTVDGKSHYATNGGTTTSNKPYYFEPESLTGHYEPTNSLGFNHFSWNVNNTYPIPDGQTTLTQMQAAFSQLATDYPDYVIETLLGNDTSGNYPVYRYNLKGAKLPKSTKQDQVTPKILLVNGLHGSEKASTFSVYYLFKDICENWKTNPLLEYLRWNVEIVAIPIANPHGFQVSGRVNSNGVDLNRNFPYGFVSSGEGTTTYSGPSALSEKESQYIKTMVDDNTDAMCFIDYHTNNGSGNDYGGLLWISLNGSVLYDKDMEIGANYTVSKMTREMIKRYGQPSDQGFFGYTSITTGLTGGLSKFYPASVGIPSTAFECFRKFPSETEYYTPQTIKACTEYFGSFVFNLIKQFSK